VEGYFRPFNVMPGLDPGIDVLDFFVGGRAGSPDQVRGTAMTDFDVGP